MTEIRVGDVADTNVRRCAHCNEPIDVKPMGRRPLYCSGACRTAGNRYGNPCPRSRIDGSAKRWCMHPPPPVRAWRW